MAVRLEKVILEVEDRASRPMAAFAAATRGASGALHDLDDTSGDSTTGVTATGKAAQAAAPKVTNLAAATARAEAAQRKQADAAGALRTAELKLAEVREKGTAKASAISAAEERVAKARRDLTAETLKAAQAAEAVTKANDNIVASNRKTDQSINQLTGRLALFRDVAVTLGPALVPIGALAVPAVTGLASALGFTAVAAGTVVAGFQGVGTALEALNKAQLEPTAANLAAARQAMQELSPAARDIVREIDSLGPALESLRDASAAGLAPGIAASVDNLSVLLPKLRGIFEETSRAAGNFAADATASLASERWEPFIDFLEREAPAAVTSLGGSMGDLSHGLAELWMAFDPLNDDVLGLIERGAEGFDKWAMDLGQTQGFRDFVEYLRTSGPQVGEAFQAIGSAVLEIAQAAAPLGGPVLAAITGIANAVGAIASSPMGTPFLAAIAAVTTLNRLLKVTSALAAAASVSTAATAGTAGAAGAVGAGGAAAAGAGAGAAGTKAVSAAQKLALPLVAVGAGSQIIEFLQDVSGGYDGVTSSVDDVAGALQRGSLPDEFKNIGDSSELLAGRNGFQQWADGINNTLGTSMESIEEANAELSALDQGFVQIAQTQGPQAASKAFDELTSSMGLSLQEIGQLKSQLPGLSDAIGTRSIGDLLNVFDGLPGVLNRSANAADNFKNSFQSATAALEGRASARDFEASIDDATAALKRNGRNLDINTAKGRENAAALDNIAGSALAVADGMRGANRVEFLKGARGDFIAMARDMGKTAAQARRLADNLGLVANQKVNPKVDLNKAPFDAVSRAIMAGLKNIDKQNPRPNADLNDGPFQGRRAAVMAALGVTDRFTATPTANLNDNASGKLAGISSQMSSLDGRTATTFVRTVMTTIRNIVPGRADGGWINGPGGPREDAIPMMLSNGEFVVNAAAAARNAALLEQINSGGRQSAAAASAPRMAPQQAVSVGFDGPAEVLVRMPDGSTQVAQMRAVARQEINAADRQESEWADR